LLSFIHPLSPLFEKERGDMKISSYNCSSSLIFREEETKGVSKKRDVMQKLFYSIVPPL
jgi:hypothetical protein